MPPPRFAMCPACALCRPRPRPHRTPPLRAVGAVYSPVPSLLPDSSDSLSLPLSPPEAGGRYPTRERRARSRRDRARWRALWRRGVRHGNPEPRPRARLSSANLGESRRISANLGGAHVGLRVLKTPRPRLSARSISAHLGASRLISHPSREVRGGRTAGSAARTHSTRPARAAARAAAAAAASPARLRRASGSLRTARPVRLAASRRSGRARRRPETRASRRTQGGTTRWCSLGCRSRPSRRSPATRRGRRGSTCGRHGRSYGRGCRGRAEV